MSLVFRAQIVTLATDGTLTEFSTPVGCDGYPLRMDASGERSLVLVWRVTPPPIPETPRKPKKAKP